LRRLLPRPPASCVRPSGRASGCATNACYSAPLSFNGAVFENAHRPPCNIQQASRPVAVVWWPCVFSLHACIAEASLSAHTYRRRRVMMCTLLPVLSLLAAALAGARDGCCSAPGQCTSPCTCHCVVLHYGWRNAAMANCLRGGESLLQAVPPLLRSVLAEEHCSGPPPTLRSIAWHPALDRLASSRRKC
jgi:hypothetical protein